MIAIMTILPRDATTGVCGLSGVMGKLLTALSFHINLSFICSQMLRPRVSVEHYALAFTKRIQQDRESSSQDLIGSDEPP
jgi:hypothetical protein